MRCVACGRDRPGPSSQTIQLMKGPGRARCIDCSDEYGSTAWSTSPLNSASNSSVSQPISQYDSGRYNKSGMCFISDDALRSPFKQGTFRWVSKGTYTAGPRKGEPCVVKWFKDRAAYEQDFYAHDMNIVQKALEIVNLFNAARVMDKVIKINIPEIWVFEEESRMSSTGQKYLCEPYIENYQKFNSNSGWTDDRTTWGKGMQALSHFGYHISGGKVVLCDIQGGVYQDDIVLTDPVITSQQKAFGPTDLGARGISSFFKHHRCNRFCQLHWRLPSDAARHFVDRTKGTSMTGHDFHARKREDCPKRSRPRAPREQIYTYHFR